MAITKCLIWVPPGEPVHSTTGSGEPVWPHQRGMVRAGLMEKIMSKSNDTSKTRELTEAELAAVSGGFFADLVKQLLATSEPSRNGPRGFSFRIDVEGIDRGGFRE
jgi:hypothetical protein